MDLVQVCLRDRSFEVLKMVSLRRYRMLTLGLLGGIIWSIAVRYREKSVGARTQFCFRIEVMGEFFSQFVVMEYTFRYIFMQSADQVYKVFWIFQFSEDYLYGCFWDFVKGLFQIVKNKEQWFLLFCVFFLYLFGIEDYVDGVGFVKSYFGIQGGFFL